LVSFKNVSLRMFFIKVTDYKSKIFKINGK